MTQADSDNEIGKALDKATVQMKSHTGSQDQSKGMSSGKLHINEKEKLKQDGYDEWNDLYGDEEDPQDWEDPYGEEEADNEGEDGHWDDEDDDEHHHLDDH